MGRARERKEGETHVVMTMENISRISSHRGFSSGTPSGVHWLCTIHEGERGKEGWEGRKRSTTMSSTRPSAHGDDCEKQRTHRRYRKDQLRRSMRREQSESRNECCLSFLGGGKVGGRREGTNEKDDGSMDGFRLELLPQDVFPMEG